MTKIGASAGFRGEHVGIQLVVSTFAGLAIGYGLDKLFGTSFLKFIFLAFGIVAGFWEIFKVVKKQEEKDSGRTDSTDDSKITKQSFIVILPLAAIAFFFTDWLFALNSVIGGAISLFSFRTMHGQCGIFSVRRWRRQLLWESVWGRFSSSSYFSSLLRTSILSRQSLCSQGLLLFWP